MTIRFWGLYTYLHRGPLSDVVRAICRWGTPPWHWGCTGTTGPSQGSRLTRWLRNCKSVVAKTILVPWSRNSPSQSHNISYLIKMKLGLLIGNFEEVLSYYRWSQLNKLLRVSDKGRGNGKSITLFKGISDPDIVQKFLKALIVLLTYLLMYLTGIVNKVISVVLYLIFHLGELVVLFNHQLRFTLNFRTILTLHAYLFLG